VRSDDINEHIKSLTGGDFSAKDFRTWNATVLAAIALAAHADADAKTARKRAVSAAIKSVAAYLGNTPAVCRRAYIDPRIIDRFQAGSTITPHLDQLEPSADLADEHARHRIEAAVLHLIRDAPTK
jgi:DNA topoisomerase IB